MPVACGRSVQTFLLSKPPSNKSHTNAGASLFSVLLTSFVIYFTLPYRSLKHKGHSFSQQKLFFNSFRTKIIQKLWCQIFKSTSSQLMFYVKKLETSIGFFRKKIFKIDLRTTISWISGVLFLRYRRYYRCFLAKSSQYTVFSENVLRQKRIGKS